MSSHEVDFNNKLEFRDGMWFINGQRWHEGLTKAIFPIRYQVVLAGWYRACADVFGDAEYAADADALEMSADADRECEIKWGAR
jgi:hypothetical protein